jgi:hypothetical protein
MLQLPPLLRLAGAKRLLLYRSPRPAQVLRMRKRRPWSPGLPSSRESIRPSPRTTKRLGLWSSHVTAYGTDTRPSFRALQMASTLESLRSTTCILRPTTITPSAYSPTHITPSFKTSLLWADTSAHSPAPSWRPIWARSRRLLSPLSPKHRSWANSGRCMTFRTPTTPCPTWLPSTRISTVMVSHAHGEPSPPSPCSSRAFPQVLRPLSAMSQRPTGPSPLPHPNGPASSSACKNMTSLQSLPATTLGSHWPVGSTAWLPTRGQTVLFSTEVPYLGFRWNLHTRVVHLLEEKKAKYLAAIVEWGRKHTHNLLETQQLYGKLLHAMLVVPAGRAYLTNLEAMLASFNRNIFLPHTPPRDTPSDLQWWKQQLSRPEVSRPISEPHPPINYNAYSDASSRVWSRSHNRPQVAHVAAGPRMEIPRAGHPMGQSHQFRAACHWSMHAFKQG